MAQVYATEMQKQKTIGEVAGILASQYFKLYKEFLNDQDKDIANKAENLAFADLYGKKLVAEFAIEGLKEKIAKYKKESFEHLHKCKSCGSEENYWLDNKGRVRYTEFCATCAIRHAEGLK